MKSEKELVYDYAAELKLLAFKEQLEGYASFGG